jgi:hypothetical protein
MKRVYRAFLLLYPREYRDLFGPEVVEVFSQAAKEHRARGWSVWVWFLVTELSGAIISAAGHWTDRLSRPRGGAGFEYASNLEKMTAAIAHRDFVAARAFSFADLKAREDLRKWVRF